MKRFCGRLQFVVQQTHCRVFYSFQLVLISHFGHFLSFSLAYCLLFLPFTIFFLFFLHYFAFCTWSHVHITAYQQWKQAHSVTEIICAKHAVWLSWIKQSLGVNQLPQCLLEIKLLQFFYCSGSQYPQTAIDLCDFKHIHNITSIYDK